MKQGKNAGRKSRVSLVKTQHVMFVLMGFVYFNPQTFDGRRGQQIDRCLENTTHSKCYDQTPCYFLVEGTQSPLGMKPMCVKPCSLNKATVREVQPALVE